MTACTCQNKLNPYALRYVRGYKPRFQRLVLRFLREKNAELGGNLRIEDVQECISMAYVVFIEDVNDRIDSIGSTDTSVTALA